MLKFKFGHYPPSWIRPKVVFMDSPLSQTYNYTHIGYQISAKSYNPRLTYWFDKFSRPDKTSVMTTENEACYCIGHPTLMSFDLQLWASGENIPVSVAVDDMRSRVMRSRHRQRKKHELASTTSQRCTLLPWAWRSLVPCRLQEKSF